MNNFSKFFSKKDLVQTGILLLVAVIAWLIVWNEFNKPVSDNFEEWQMIQIQK